MTASRISGIIPLLFITLVCVGMVEGGYQVFEHFVLDAHPGKTAGMSDAPAEKAEPKETVVQKKIGAEVILQRNLFGALAGDKPAVPAVPEKTEVLTVSSLQVVLMGTITGSEGTERAIIFDKRNSKQELYGKGEAVQGARVKEIRRGKVILAQNGRDEILDISEAAKVRPRVTAPPTPGPVQPVPAPKAVTPPDKNNNPPEVDGNPPEGVPEPPPEAAAEPPAEVPDNNATQIRLTRVSHPARGREPGSNNLRSNATQHQGNVNE